MWYLEVWDEKQMLIKKININNPWKEIMIGSQCQILKIGQTILKH